jgi:hypothetical protein
LTSEFQELKDQHKDHTTAETGDYNTYQLHQWHNQDLKWDQMVVVHEAVICLAHGQVEQDHLLKHTAADVAVAHQEPAEQFMLYTTRMNNGF